MINPVAIQDRPVDEATYRYFDLLEIARLVSWCTNREYLIKTCLEHISQKLKARARCAILEGDDLKLVYWIGEDKCPMEQIVICRESIVWDVVRKGEPFNLTDPSRAICFEHTLGERVKMKAVVPLIYVDPLSQIERKIGVLIVDSSAKDTPVSRDDFEYLKAIGDLIGAAVGKARLVTELIESYEEREAIVRITAHNFRNRIVAIGGFSGRIARLAKDDDLARETAILCEEAALLEGNLREFEKSICEVQKD